MQSWAEVREVAKKAGREFELNLIRTEMHESKIYEQDPTYSRAPTI